MKRKFAACVLAGVMTVGMFAGCGSNGGTTSEKGSGSASGGTVVSDEKIDVLNQEETMKLSVVCLQGYTQPDSETQKWMEDRYNLDIEVIALPGWSDATAKISLLMGDETQRPDIIWWWNMDADYTKWVDAGLLVDVAPYMDKYTNIRDYYNDVDPGVLFYASDDSGSIYRIPGDVAEPACETLWIRQDWLDNLGLSVPTTLDELEDVLYKFTFDDPDGNGVNDTYGWGGDGYDLRSFWPWIQGAGEGYGRDTFLLADDGTYIYGPTTEDCKEWLGRVSKLYADGVITPNIITDTDRDEEMANGGFGATYSWVTWNNPSTGVMQSFYATNPDAKWVPIDMVAGDNGTPQDDPASISAWCYFGITNVCSDPERAYAIWDDLAAPENYIRKRFGVQDRDWKDNGDGTYDIINPWDGGVNTENNYGINLFQDLFARKDECNIANTTETTELFEKVKENSRLAYARSVEKKNPSAYTVNNDLGTDIGDIMKEYVWGVIGGNKSLDNWDAYVSDIENAGVQDVLDELAELHGAQREQYEEYMKNYEANNQ
ncbi:MAG: extracellular solute-binding protein [Fusicatenibacter sp.]|nr:extracellular solute-binding protein [Fusicatenibacter sp.]